MAHPWDRRPGEPWNSYQRFEQFLSLGAGRNLSELARRIGVTPSALSQTSRRFNWKERAEAWQAAHPDGTYDPPEIERVERQASPPPPKPPPKVVIPEVLGALAAADHNDQVTEGTQFRDAFRVKGKALLEFSNRIQETAEASHEDLSLSWKLRRQALDRQDFQAAESLCRQIVQLTPCFWRTVEATLNTARHGHDYWGNSAALFELISEAYGGKT